MDEQSAGWGRQGGKQGDGEREGWKDGWKDRQTDGRTPHRHPADLGPQVAEVEGGGGAHGQALQHVLVLQGPALCGDTRPGDRHPDGVGDASGTPPGTSHPPCGDTYWGPGAGTVWPGTTGDLWERRDGVGGIAGIAMAPGWDPGHKGHPQGATRGLWWREGSPRPH